MPTRPLKALVVWLLLLAQAMAWSTPAALLVCREQDGTSHIELSVTQCCFETDRPGFNAQSDAPAFNACLDTGCVDEPLETSPALTNTPSRICSTYSVVPSFTVFFSETSPKRAKLPVTLRYAYLGVPLQINLALASVVLVL